MADARTTPAADWRAQSRARGVDPGEVAMVSDRYAAYRDFMAGRPGTLSLEAWFRFYRLEKSSDRGGQAGGVISGCSATGEATGEAALEHPEFLELMRLRLEAGPPALP